MDDPVESVRHGKSIGEPPPRPEYFDERYVLPIHSDNLILHRLHHHPRDDMIIFHEKPHLYVVNGEIMEQSISSLAHHFEDPFNSIMGIRAMQKSRSQAWPRHDYVLGLNKVNSSNVDITKGFLINDKNKKVTIASIGPDTSRVMTFERLLDMLRSVSTKQIKIEDEEYYNFEREETDNEIKQKWERLGLFARNEGTEAHLMMELWSNSLPVRYDDPEVKVGLDFIRKHLVPLGAKVYKTEWEIFGEEECVAGSIDLAVILPNGNLYLIDWKRSVKLPQKLIGYTKFKEPLSNLEQCNGCTYSMQLSSYQYIIEKYYGFKIAGRCLVSLHPDKPFHTSVPFLEKEVEYIMQNRRIQNQTRKRLAKDINNSHLLCCITGHIAENAVQDENGKIYWDKAAILHDIQNTTPCEHIAKEVENILMKETPLANFPEGLVPWRKIFTGAKSDLMGYSK
tara:strand:+ start:1304 stop:2659 length:1356 start_codon:yes stop_codon:yes gene_type:complete